MAEHNLIGPVLGIAMDGTGYSPMEPYGGEESFFSVKAININD
nr:hypothetical protein [Veillonella rogosae]